MAPASTATKVAVWADAALPGLAWRALLSPQPGLQVLGTAVTQDDLLALLANDRQTAVLLDQREPLEPLVLQLITAVPTAGLLCLVNNYELNQTVALLQAGAVGVLSRSASLPELTRALIAASRGEIVLPPNLAARALAVLARGGLPAQQNLTSLTDREREVLALLARGFTNKDIAQTLFLSVRTVEAHLRNVYGKLDVATRTEAVLWAVQHGLDQQIT